MQVEVTSTDRAGSPLFNLTDAKKKPEGISFKPYFTEGVDDPFDTVEWNLRSACIINDKEDIIFKQDGIEVPKSWSQTALNIVASKYFYGSLGKKDREDSIRQLIWRVVDTIAKWGYDQGYFYNHMDSIVFRNELTYILLHQMTSFNSPVWFNLGVVDNPQCSGCFINSVDDNMGSILDLVRTEGLIFKNGSGTGTNFSNIRSKREGLSGGGGCSGPVSFMKGFDAFAGVIKSAGQTRRAAKMVILDVNHPDIIEFIRCKIEEERKAWDLIDIGYDGGIDGSAYASIFFQNANNTVRVTNDFMKAVVDDGDWETIARTTKKTLGKHKARRILDEIAESVWKCGDPGIQFDTVVNDWHTCPTSGRINASNPCGEYMFLDDSSCNLASLNLVKFLGGRNKFDINGFKHAVKVMITAQDILVDKAGYPTEKIGKNAHKFRSLGLGYANLGAMLMIKGLPYDSEKGRAYAGAITSLMTGEAYKQSAILAQNKGAFEEYNINSGDMLKVIEKHVDSWKLVATKNYNMCGAELNSLINEASISWNEAARHGVKYGFRNAQVTLLAPTGTIAFMMDCVTTGIEPDLALIKYKNLVGGGVIRIVNQVVSRSLKSLGYSCLQVQEIVDYIDKNGTIEGAPELLEGDLPIFDCAICASGGTRFISPKGHIRMLAAVQPFLSGAISKTVNMPSSATEEDIKKVFIDSWKLGLKSIAVYREGSKRIQPLMTSKNVSTSSSQRKKLADERKSIIHKFSIAGHGGYIIVGMYDDGTPGEIFIRMSKAGSTVSGLMDSLAISVSLSLQYGVPLSVLADKYIGSSFEPAGFTGNPDILFARSVVDYIFRWLSVKFLGHKVDMKSDSTFKIDKDIGISDDAIACRECGSLMVRSGICYSCNNCGATSGCG